MAMERVGVVLAAAERVVDWVAAVEGVRGRVEMGGAAEVEMAMAMEVETVAAAVGAETAAEGLEVAMVRVSRVDSDKEPPETAALEAATVEAEMERDVEATEAALMGDWVAQAARAAEECTAPSHPQIADYALNIHSDWRQ